jgi:hypothetical protein
VVGAGWYLDPQDKSRYRWWDGSQWTDIVGAAGQSWNEPLDARIDTSDWTAENWRSVLETFDDAGIGYRVQGSTLAVDGHQRRDAAKLLGWDGVDARLPDPAATPGRALAPTAVAAPTEGVAQLRPMRPLAVAVCLSLAAVVVVAGFGVEALIEQRRILHLVEQDRFVRRSRAHASDDYVWATTVLRGLANVALVVSLMTWLWRGTRNVVAFGKRPPYAVGWAVGSWFVPIAQFVIPFQMLSAVSRAPHPDGDARARYAPVSLWLFWLSWVALFAMSGFARNGGVGTDASLDSNSFYLVVWAATVVPAVAAAVLVWQTASAHDASPVARRPGGAGLSAAAGGC